MTRHFLDSFIRRQRCLSEIDRLADAMARQREQAAEAEFEMKRMLDAHGIPQGVIRYNGQDYLIESHDGVRVLPLTDLAYLTGTNGHPHRAVPPEPVIPGDADQCRPDPEPVPREALEALDLAGVEGY